MNPSHYTIQLMNLCTYIHMTLSPKQKGDSNSTYMNRLRFVISRTWGKGDREGMNYHMLNGRFSMPRKQNSCIQYF